MVCEWVYLPESLLPISPVTLYPPLTFRTAEKLWKGTAIKEKGIGKCV